MRDSWIELDGGYTVTIGQRLGLSGRREIRFLVLAPSLDPARLRPTRCWGHFDDYGSPVIEGGVCEASLLCGLSLAFVRYCDEHSYIAPAYRGT